MVQAPRRMWIQEGYFAVLFLTLIRICREKTAYVLRSLEEQIQKQNLYVHLPGIECLHARVLSFTSVLHCQIQRSFLKFFLGLEAIPWGLRDRRTSISFSISLHSLAKHTGKLDFTCSSATCKRFIDHLIVAIYFSCQFLVSLPLASFDWLLQIIFPHWEQGPCNALVISPFALRWTNFRTIVLRVQGD